MSAEDADAYLAKLSADKRATLEKVRKAIRAAAPKAEEGLSYGMPTFIQGKPIAGYSASAEHCSYFPMSGSVTATLAGDLTAYKVSKGGFQFPIGKPPPATLIKKLVKARLAELEGGAPKVKRKGADGDLAVFMQRLDHPLKREIETLRAIVTGIDAGVSEGVKWNAPSFRTENDWFATVNLRSRDQVQVIVHLGAKKRVLGKALRVPDSEGLLRWLADDRALLSLGAGRAFTANRRPMEAILRAWVKLV